MIWPGMGDPAKRKQTLRFLAITAGIAISIGLASTAIQNQFNADNPLKQCIDNHDIKYKISATVEIIVNGEKAEILQILVETPDAYILFTHFQMMEWFMQSGKKNILLK